MAVLTSEQRAEIAQRFITEFFVALSRTADLSSTEVRTLINDLDTWLDGAATNANNSITAAVRTKASTDTKFAALAWVALKRAGLV